MFRAIRTSWSIAVRAMRACAQGGAGPGAFAPWAGSPGRAIGPPREPERDVIGLYPLTHSLRPGNDLQCRKIEPSLHAAQRHLQLIRGLPGLSIALS